MTKPMLRAGPVSVKHVANIGAYGYLEVEAGMKKEPDESWPHYFMRSVKDLARDGNDRKYWSNVFAMAGAASLAVTFINGDPIAFYGGFGFCLYGLKLNREKVE